jgi:hypothetical protein
MSMWRNRPHSQRERLLRSALVLLLAAAIAGAWAGSFPATQDRPSGAALAQGSPISPLNPVTILSPVSAPPNAGVAAFVSGRAILLWVTTVLALMATSVAVAYWRRS